MYTSLYKSSEKWVCEKIDGDCLWHKTTHCLITASVTVAQKRKVSKPPQIPSSSCPCLKFIQLPVWILCFNSVRLHWQPTLHTSNATHIREMSPHHGWQGQVPQQGSWGFNPHVYFTHPLGVNDVSADIKHREEVGGCSCQKQRQYLEVDLCKCN